MIASCSYHKEPKTIIHPNAVSHLLRKELDASHEEGALYSYFELQSYKS
jgi:hypothetical protein